MDGSIKFYNEKIAYINKEPPKFEINVVDIKEVKMTKSASGNSPEKFYFHILKTNGERIVFYTKDEELTTGWI